MKTKSKQLLFAVSGTILLGGGVWMSHLRSQDGSNSDMLLANIEAMADGEVDAGYVKNSVPRWGDEPGFWTEDGSKFCVPHWESVECWDEAPDGQWCQSSYHRSVHCY